MCFFAFFSDFIVETADVDDRCDLLVSKLQQVDNISALALSGHARYVINFQPVALASIGKNQQVIVGRGDEQMLNEIAFFCIRADNSSAASGLLAVGIDGKPLDVSAVTYRDDNFLLGDQVFIGEHLGGSGDFCPPGVTELFLYFINVFPDDVQQDLIAGQYRLIAFYLLDQVSVFFSELFHLQAGKPLQLHRQNRISLRAGKEMFALAFLLNKSLGQDFLQRTHFGQPQRLLHQVQLCGGGVRRFLYQIDNFIDVTYRQKKTFENVGPVLASFQQEPASSADDYFAMLNEAIEHLPDIECFRPVIDQRDTGDGKSGLQKSVTIQLIQYDIGFGVFFQVHDNPQPVAIRFISDVGYFRERIIVNAIRDLRDYRGLDDHIRYLSNDDSLPALFSRFNIDFSSNLQVTPTGRISVHYPFSATDNSACWEVRAG